MLRISTEENGTLTRFRLEGKLKGDWVRELERCWVNAREVRMVSQGGRLEAHNNFMSASLVDEIAESSPAQRVTFSAIE